MVAQWSHRPLCPVGLFSNQSMSNWVNTQVYMQDKWYVYRMYLYVQSKYVQGKTNTLIFNLDQPWHLSDRSLRLASTLWWASDRQICFLGRGGSALCLHFALVTCFELTAIPKSTSAFAEQHGRGKGKTINALIWLIRSVAKPAVHLLVTLYKVWQLDRTQKATTYRFSCVTEAYCADRCLMASICFIYTSDCCRSTDASIL